MHFPPAVSYPFDRSATPWSILLAVLVAGGGVCAALAVQQSDARTWVALGVAWGIALSGLATAWFLAPVGRLVWDAEHWHCTAWPALDIRGVRIAMDFQSRVLVVLKPSGLRGPRWLWLARKADTQQWHALRCALVSARQSPVIYQ